MTCTYLYFTSFSSISRGADTSEVYPVVHTGAWVIASGLGTKPWCLLAIISSIAIFTLTHKTLSFRHNICSLQGLGMQWFVPKIRYTNVDW